MVLALEAEKMSAMKNSFHDDRKVNAATATNPGPERGMMTRMNEPIREQMEHNANIYDQVAEAVAKDPLAILD